MESLTLHQEEEEDSSMKALGSLFKFTEVYLLDYSSGQTQEGSILLEIEKPIRNTDIYAEDASPYSGFSSLPEDIDLARQMNEMGLPMSFHTNKKRNRTARGKRKDEKKENIGSCGDTQNEVLNSIQVQNDDCESKGDLHGETNEDSSCMSILAQSEFSSCHGVDIDDHSLIGGEESLKILRTCSTHIPLNECIPCNQQPDLSLDNTNTVSMHDKLQLGKDVGIMVSSSLECGNGAGSCLINSSAESGWTNEEGYDGHCEGTPLIGEQMESPCTEIILNGEQIESKMQTFLSAEHDKEDGKLCNDVGGALNNCNTINVNDEGTFDDWRLYWDNDYQRNYFYNTVTSQCTWDPPPGMEDLVFTNLTTEQRETSAEVVELDVSLTDSIESNKLPTAASIQPDLDLSDGFGDDDVLLDRHLHESEGRGQVADGESEGRGQVVDSESEGRGQVADNSCSLSSIKHKTQIRKTKSRGKFPTSQVELQLSDIMEEISPNLDKYWFQRYLLFNKYDEGIQMDEEGWFSVTPEAIAKHHALRCGCGTIVDFFTGVGGNSIQFAKRSNHVIAIDIDPKKIGFAQNNAAIYGVCDQIDFIRGDSFILAPKLKADVVFMSPPWGGPDYTKEKTFDMKTMLKPCDGNFLFTVGRSIASKVVMFLPRNVDINQLAELSLSVNPPWSLEVEKNFLNGKLKAVTAYFSKPL